MRFILWLNAVILDWSPLILSLQAWRWHNVIRSSSWNRDNPNSSVGKQKYTNRRKNKKMLQKAKQEKNMWERCAEDRGQRTEDGRDVRGQQETGDLPTAQPGPCPCPWRCRRGWSPSSAPPRTAGSAASTRQFPEHRQSFRVFFM